MMKTYATMVSMVLTNEKTLKSNRHEANDYACILAATNVFLLEGYPEYDTYSALIDDAYSKYYDELADDEKQTVIETAKKLVKTFYKTLGTKTPKNHGIPQEDIMTVNF